VRGLGERTGGYHRFLWAEGVGYGPEIEQECIERWPIAFTGQQPVFRFKGGGISVNLSFKLDAQLHTTVSELGERLALHANSQ